MTGPSGEYSDGIGPSNWYSGPVAPADVRKYAEWLLDEFDGSVVESPAEASYHYHIEVTKLTETPDGSLRPVDTDTDRS